MFFRRMKFEYFFIEYYDLKMDFYINGIVFLENIFNLGYYLSLLMCVMFLK